jgi:hypothetical protein
VDESEVARKWHNLRLQINSEVRKIKNDKGRQGSDDAVFKSTGGVV